MFQSKSCVVTWLSAFHATLLSRMFSVLSAKICVEVTPSISRVTSISPLFGFSVRYTAVYFSMEVFGVPSASVVVLTIVKLSAFPATASRPVTPTITPLETVTAIFCEAVVS